MWGIHGVYAGYSWSIHGVYVCIGYVSGMYRVCIGNVSEHLCERKSKKRKVRGGQGEDEKGIVKMRREFVYIEKK